MSLDTLDFLSATTKFDQDSAVDIEYATTMIKTTLPEAANIGKKQEVNLFQWSMYALEISHFQFCDVKEHLFNIITLRF